MKLVIITGPPAVGKMTVGRELAKITGLTLFHNHMSIELVQAFFDFGTPSFEYLNNLIRFEIFKEVAKSTSEGLIFTMVWDYDCEEDEQFINDTIDIFKQQQADICLVELQAPLDVRLKRNVQEERLEQKPSKRNLEQSKESLLYFEQHYRMNSAEDEFDDRFIYRINNADKTAAEVAAMIKTQFRL
ncbi:MAG: AAA family ATPase [Bacteroidota bacterium]